MNLILSILFYLGIGLAAHEIAHLAICQERNIRYGQKFGRKTPPLYITLPKGCDAKTTFDYTIWGLIAGGSSIAVLSLWDPFGIVSLIMYMIICIGDLEFLQEMFSKTEVSA